MPTSLLCVIVLLSYWRWNIYTAGIQICAGMQEYWMVADLFFGPMTLTLTRWPSYTNLTRIPWSCTGCANMNSLCQGFWTLSSDRHTYRLEVCGSTISATRPVPAADNTYPYPYPTRPVPKISTRPTGIPVPVAYPYDYHY